MKDLLYDALMLGRSKKVAREEYLIATGRKTAVRLSLREEKIEIANVISDGRFSVHLNINAGPDTAKAASPMMGASRQNFYADAGSDTAVEENTDSESRACSSRDHQEMTCSNRDYQESSCSRGYLEIEVFSKDPFITFARKVITSEEFKNGEYEFIFNVSAGMLHNGKNFGMLTFRTYSQKIDVPIVIDNRIRQKADFNSKELICRIEKSYLDLKMGRIDPRQWQTDALLQLQNIPGTDEKSLYLMLYKAQILITLKDYSRAKNYIEYVGEQIGKLQEKNYDLYSYFVYVTGLYEQDGDSGAEQDMSALQKVAKAYSIKPGWRILWMMFYMDPNYENDPARKLREIKTMYYRGHCFSPVMYFEALDMITKNPAMLNSLDEFSVQVLNFAVKSRYLTQELSQRTVQMVLSEDEEIIENANKTLIIKILKYIYELYPSADALGTLCMMLIDGGIKDKSVFKYYEKAVLSGQNIPGLMDFYIYSIDKENMPAIPDAVFEYFDGHGDDFYEYKPCMYAYMISNRFRRPEIFRKYKDRMLEFAEDQMSIGANDEFMAVIYKEILDRDMLNENMKQDLYNALCTKQINCANERMSSVLVLHKELMNYQESFLYKGKCFVKIYSPDALILFKDITGNLYVNVEYSVNSFLDAQEYIDICFKEMPINKYMFLENTLPLLRAFKEPAQILAYISEHKIDGQFRPEYQQELLQKLIDYYAKNSRDENVCDELLKFRDYDLAPATRSRLIEIMISKGYFDDALMEINEYGCEEMSNEAVTALAKAYILLHGQNQDDTLDMLCEMSFLSSGFDPVIMDYLYKFYDRKQDVLIEIFRTCCAYNVISDNIEKRILEKAADEKNHPDIVSYVFKKFYDNFGDRETVKKYLTFRAEDYLYTKVSARVPAEGMKNTDFFESLGYEFIRGQNFSDETAIAYLLFMAESDIVPSGQTAIMQKLLEELVKKGKMLQEFKKLSRYFELPAALANHIIISGYYGPGREGRFLQLEILERSRNIKNEYVSVFEEFTAMKEIFPGYFVKYVTLFYGQKIRYRSSADADPVVLDYEEGYVVNDGSVYGRIDSMQRLNSDCHYREDNADLEKLKAEMTDHYMSMELVKRLF